MSIVGLTSFISTEADEEGRSGSNDEGEESYDEYDNSHFADENDGRAEASKFSHPDLQWLHLAPGFIVAKTLFGSDNDYYISEEGISRENLKIKCLMINHVKLAKEIGRLNNRITICDMYLNIDDEGTNDMALSIIKMLSGPHYLNDNNETAEVVTGSGAIATGEVDFSQLPTMMPYSEKRKKCLINFLETDRRVKQFDKSKINNEKNAIERIKYHYVANKITCRCGCGDSANIKCRSCHDKFGSFCLETPKNRREKFCPVCVLCPPSMLDLLEDYEKSEEEESESDDDIILS